MSEVFYMIIQVFGAFGAVVTLAIMFSVPKKYLLYSGAAGSAGWLVYLLCMKVADNVTASMFFATVFVALCSHIFARIKKAPVTLFLIAGILPLVPGVGMYRIVYYLLLSDTAQAGFYFFFTLKVAGVISLAIFLVDTCFKLKKIPYHFDDTKNTD